MLTYLLVGGLGSGCEDEGKEASSTAVSSLIDLRALEPTVVQEVHFEPAAPAPGQEIRITVNTRPGTPPVKLRFDWSINDEPVSSVPGNVLPSGLTSEGDSVQVKVIPFNEGGPLMAYRTPPLSIHAGTSGRNLADGSPCSSDQECRSHSCGLTADGNRCIGSEKLGGAETRASLQAFKNLERDTNLGIEALQKAEAERMARSGRTQSSKRRYSSPSGASSYNSWASPGVSDSNRGALGLGANCTNGGYCGERLICKGTSELKTCVPGR